MVNGGSLETFSWAPDSSRIAYRADQDTINAWELYTALPDGTGILKVSPPLVFGGDVYAPIAWSHDSSRIAYPADQDTLSQVELYSSLRDGTGNVRISGPMVLAGAVTPTFAWAPDDSRIVYRADQDTNDIYELYTSLPDGTGNVKINVRAARGLLHWSARELAERAGVHLSTIQRMEHQNGRLYGRMETVYRIQTTLEKAGVEFISDSHGGPGVRLRHPVNDAALPFRT